MPDSTNPLHAMLRRCRDAPNRSAQRRAQRFELDQQLERGQTIWTHLDPATFLPRGQDSGHVLVIGEAGTGTREGPVLMTLRTWTADVLTLSHRDALARDTRWLPEAARGQLLHTRHTFALDHARASHDLEDLIGTLGARPTTSPHAIHVTLDPHADARALDANAHAIEALFEWARTQSTPVLCVFEEPTRWAPRLQTSASLRELLDAPRNARVLATCREPNSMEALPFNTRVMHCPTSGRFAREVSTYLDDFDRTLGLERRPRDPSEAWVLRAAEGRYERGRIIKHNNLFFIHHLETNRSSRAHVAR